MSKLVKLFNKTPVPLAPRVGNSFSLSKYSVIDNLQTYMRAYATSGTVYSIVHLLSQSVAEPAWHLYKKQPQDGRRRYTTGDQGSDQRTEIVTHPALSIMKQPNPYYTTFEFMEASQQHIELTGECFWMVDYGGGKTTFPTNLWLIRPDMIDVVPSPDNYIQGYIFKSPDGVQIPIEVNEIIHTKMANPLDQYRGVGPIQTVMSAIDALRKASDYNRNFFLNDATPGGVIQIPDSWSDREWDEFTERWREAHQGLNRAHRIAVLQQGAQWVPMSPTPKDMDFVHLIEENRDLIREAFGIHKAMLGNANDVNRANAETAEEVFAAWQLIPRLNRIRETWNCKFLPLFGSMGEGVEFDYENPSPDDREADNAELVAKSNSAKVLVEAGWKPDEVLLTVGLPAMEFVQPPVSLPAPFDAGGLAAEESGSGGGGGSSENAQNEPRGYRGEFASTSTVITGKSAAVKVFSQEAEQYPAHAMAWMHHASWSGPVKVPLDHVQPDMRWMDKSSPDHVQDFVNQIRDGKKLKPVILVKTPGSSKPKLVDGHHRYLAAKQENVPLRAYIGTVDSDHGGWETMHDYQYGVTNRMLDDISEIMKYAWNSAYRTEVRT